MARPVGTRNADYEATKDALTEKVSARLLADGGAHASFRELAAAADVTPATLRHYFESREGLIRSAFMRFRKQGLSHMLMAVTSQKGPAPESLRWLLTNLMDGWQYGMGRMHALGISAGMNDAQLGPAYLTDVLEPIMQVIEARIAQHVAAGELGVLDARHAAIELMAPVLYVLAHQDRLHGASVRPLDQKKFLDDHLERFLRAHAPAPKA